jgi:tetratricopeptide (TPR) repeat protein
MGLSVSPWHSSRIVAAHANLLRLFTVFMAFLFSIATSAQQSVPKKPGSPQSRRPQLQFEEVEDLVRQGSLDQAKQKIQDVLGQNPTSVEANNLLGIICTGQKDFSCALDAFQRGLRLAPNSTRTRNNLGNLYAVQGKPDLAEKEFRSVVRLDPANRDGNYNLGLILMAKNRPAEAIPHFQRARPANLETKLNLIRALLQAHRTNEGLKAAADVSDEKKDDIEVHVSLGVLLAAEKQYKSAQVELEKANALRPETFEILFNLGQAYLRDADYDKAEQALNRALKLKPESPETLYLLAQAAADESRPVDALDLLVRARKLAPENTDVISLLARVSMTQNYYEDAIPLLESGLKIAPARADLHAALGESYFMSGKAEKAIEEFKNLIQIDTSPRSYTFMGLAYRHLGRFDEARKYFAEGLKLSPRDAPCLFNLGYIEEHQGHHDKAEELFQQSLRSNPDFSEALFELANLRIDAKHLEEAAQLLRRYVKVTRNAASGYYKLAMVERALHQLDAAQRDLQVFQTLSKEASSGPYPYQHLFDYLDNRSALSAEDRTQLDLTELTAQIEKHPGQAQDLYLLAEAYLKLAKVDEARKTIAQLDQLSSGDYRTETGIGVLFARFRLYDDAIRHFQAALAANPDSDDVKFDLTDALFRRGLYSNALEAAQQVSPSGQQDDSFLALLGDIYAHLGDSVRAEDIFSQAIKRNPDNDQYYLSLTLVQLREKDITGAEDTLGKGLARIPSSGKILWGLGIVSVLEGKTPQAAQHLERAVDLLPEWPGSYSTLGVFYFQTGEISKAREVLNRFKGSSAGGLDVDRIEQALSNAPATASTLNEPMPTAARQQLLEFALSIADRTL